MRLLLRLYRVRNPVVKRSVDFIVRRRFVDYLLEFLSKVQFLLSSNLSNRKFTTPLQERTEFESTVGPGPAVVKRFLLSFLCTVHNHQLKGLHYEYCSYCRFLLYVIAAMNWSELEFRSRNLHLPLINGRLQRRIQGSSPRFARCPLQPLARKC